MTYGCQPKVDDGINWVTDEDGNVLGNMSPDGRQILPPPRAHRKIHPAAWPFHPPRSIKQ